MHWRVFLRFFPTPNPAHSFLCLYICCVALSLIYNTGFMPIFKVQFEPLQSFPEPSPFHQMFKCLYLCDFTCYLVCDPCKAGALLALFSLLFLISSFPSISLFHITKQPLLQPETLSEFQPFSNPSLLAESQSGISASC